MKRSRFKNKANKTKKAIDISKKKKRNMLLIWINELSLNISVLITLLTGNHSLLFW